MPNCSTQEWDLRCDLAAAYRLIAHFGMDDLIANHISVRLPGDGHRFLINRYGMMFDEVTASSLVIVNPEGHVIESQEASKINNAGFTIHSALHMSRPDAHCVMHTHTLAGMAVAAQREGLLPLNQLSMIFYGRTAYHDYEGPVLNLDERDRLVRDLGDRDVMILKHHGLLTLGQSVGEAFLRMYWLDRACQVQVAAQAGGIELPPEKVAAFTAAESTDYAKGRLPWVALKRRLDRVNPGYAT